MRVSAEERKEQLIAATVELMRREGVQSVTMRAIAKEANAPLATAHYCFSDKERTHGRGRRGLVEEPEPLFQRRPGPSGTAKGRGTSGRRLLARTGGRARQAYLPRSNSFCGQHAMPAASPLAAKIYPAYEVELGNIFSAAAQTTVISAA